MLTEVEEGQYYLEDLNAQVPLDISEAVRTYWDAFCSHFQLSHHSPSGAGSSYRGHVYRELHRACGRGNERWQISCQGLKGPGICCCSRHQESCVACQTLVSPPPQQRLDALRSTGNLDLFRTGISSQV